MKNKIMRYLGAIMNSFALMLVVQSANTACVWIFHQPEFPEEANRYRKLK